MSQTEAQDRNTKSLMNSAKLIAAELLLPIGQEAIHKIKTQQLIAIECGWKTKSHGAAEICAAGVLVVNKTWNMKSDMFLFGGKVSVKLPTKIQYGTLPTCNTHTNTPAAHRSPIRRNSMFQRV